MEKEYSKQQLEDKALKGASMYFGKELLPYFGIGKKIFRPYGKFVRWQSSLHRTMTVK